jgi:tetratricopeptide (TPR) repeat protein
MQEERLKILFQYLEEEPNEPFNVYAIAMEYINKDIQKAKFYLERLLTEYPDYLPTYYHVAAVYVDLEDFTKAENIYKLGIEKAQHQQSMKAFDELNRAYRMFLDEME